MFGVDPGQRVDPLDDWLRAEQLARFIADLVDVVAFRWLAAGMVSLGQVALDSIKVRANASRRKAMNCSKVWPAARPGWPRSARPRSPWRMTPVS